LAEQSFIGRRFAARARKACRDQPIAALSLAVSSLAFLIAAGGFYTSRQAFNQTYAQYAEERALVLSAKFAGRFFDTADSLTVMPTDGGFHFMQGSIQFPSVIIDGVQPIEEDGRVWGMKTVEFNINAYVMKNFPAKEGFANFVQLGLPILIQSVYTTKGRAYVDRSLYELRYNGTIVEDKREPINPKFDGLKFVAHIGAEDHLPEKYLDVSFERGVSQLGNK
jgi:hypothetical protein